VRYSDCLYTPKVLQAWEILIQELVGFEVLKEVTKLSLSWTKPTDVTVTVTTCIREVLGSKLGWDPFTLFEVLRGFSQSL
jgi:hypothetical protein